MRIVEPYARLVEWWWSLTDGTVAMVPAPAEWGKQLLRKIEWCGRISHRSEDAQTPDSYLRFIQAVVIEHGDWSIVEHASATVDFLVDRGITHELVRHRLFSFTQESTRFVNYDKKRPPSFVLPFDIAAQHEADENGVLNQWWDEAIDKAENSYRTLVRDGCPPQIARSVLPNALASRILVTGNLRNWRHFLLMRTTRESHPQMRQVTIPLLEQFKTAIPLLYDDIEPGAKQSDNLKKAR